METDFARRVGPPGTRQHGEAGVPTGTDFYQIVKSCLELRIHASLVTSAIPSASAVAPIRYSARRVT
jgi:hypothetical protein